MGQVNIKYKISIEQINKRGIKMELRLKRVSYGKESTPLDSREYSLGQHYPVGCKGEIEEFYKGKGFSQILLCSKDGTVVEQEINY